MPTVLVTGTNRGIGLELVRQYAADGWSVIACCRDPELADALTPLAHEGVRVEELDVADDASVAALARRLDGVPIDLVINNAGMYGDREAGRLGKLEADAWMTVFRVNSVAPLLVTQALLPNLRAAAAASGHAVVAAVSSKMGSIADNSSGGSYVYRSSKAALNAAMKSLAHDLAGDGILAVTLHPGWVRTDMGGPGGLIDTTESAAGLRGVIAGLSSAQAGNFYDYAGREIPW